MPVSAHEPARPAPAAGRGRASAEDRGRAGAEDPGFGVYVHWPFCQSICPYCDFNRRLADGVDHGRWAQALVAELEHFQAETPGRGVTSVFFGGGTPSLMEPETVAAVIAAVRARWAAADDLEVTLEANPSSAEAGRFRAFREAGVNRLSVGVQSFRDETLKFLGRRHSAAEARDALGAAADAFERFSFDLIYGLPGQSAADWAGELDAAGAFAGGHLSVYQLTIESGTPFHRDGVEAADEKTGAALYRTTQERLEALGLPAYEVSNHARPGAECRHNLSAWRGGDYVGVGPGAHGRLTGRLTGLLTGRPAREGGTDALYQVHDPGRWLAAVEAKGHATAKRRTLSPGARAEELVMTGLRLAEGVDRARFARLTGLDWGDVLDPAGLRRMVEGGFVEMDDDLIRATAAGRLRLNAVLGRLLAGA
ncbi:MAG: radical SAM family heme chaperone HemW [Rhodospirillales bacterium]